MLYIQLLPNKVENLALSRFALRGIGSTEGKQLRV